MREFENSSLGADAEHPAPAATGTFRHTADMGEISGFGGGYESCCQDMLEAGVKFLTAKQGAEFAVLSNPRIYGIVKLEGADAEALEKAVLDAAKGEATGAMHHAVMSRLAYIGKNGWESYCAELRKRETGASAAEQEG